MRKQFENGRISSRALRRLGRSFDDTGLPPPGAVSSRHIDDAAYNRAGSGFGNSERDFGPADAGGIDAKANRRDYTQKLRGRKPAAPPQWQARWFDYPSRIKWDSGRGTPPAAEQEAGGLPSGSNQVTGQSALARARRGET
jgi:hypothetical protein